VTASDSELHYCSSVNNSSEGTVLLLVFRAVFWQQLPAETATGSDGKRKWQEEKEEIRAIKE
jgi:hypothetical protein